MSKKLKPSVSVHPLETLGQTSERDHSVLNQLEGLVAEKGHPLRHVLALWPCYVQRVNLTRFLAHYELFQNIVDMPGCIVECGVGRGSSLFTWSRLMEIFCPNDRQRRVYGFDWFEGLKFTPEDGRQVESSHYMEGGWSAAAAADEVRKLVSIVNEDNIISKSVRCKLIEGDVNRALGGNVYDCLRHHPDAVKLISDRAVVNYVELLLGTRDIYYAIDQIHFRIDRKDEGRFSLPWHQDYWWNNTSKNALTVWYSLVDVTAELGPMRFLLGSHKRVAKVRIDPHYKTKWDQNQLFEIAEPVEEAEGTDIPVKAGDAVFLNALALHRSGVNRSDKNRWSVLTRYVDMFDPDFVAKGWKSGIRTGYVSLLDTDPQCIVNLDEVKEASV